MSRRISVYESDPGRYSCDLDPHVTAAAQRRISNEEYAELMELQAAYKRYQTLLEEMSRRPEVEFEEAWHEEELGGGFETQDAWESHVYCSVCRECINCNLRPCRDGGAHKE